MSASFSHGSSRHEHRKAESVVSRVAHRLALHHKANVGDASFQFSTGLLYELPASTHSKLALAFRKYGYVMRICFLRRNFYSPQVKRQKVSVREPQEPPSLVFGKTVVWYLDMRADAHQRKWLHYFATVPIPMDVKIGTYTWLPAVYMGVEMSA